MARATTREERHLRVKQLAKEISLGSEPHDAVDRLAIEWKIKNRVTKLRYIRAVNAMWSREQKLTKDAQLSTAIAMRQRLVREAMGREKVVTVCSLNPKSGKVVRVSENRPDPDFSAALSAMESIARLAGLTQEESVNVYVEGLGPVMSAMADGLKREFQDPALLARIVRVMRQAVECGEVETRPAEIQVLPAPSQNGHAGTNGKAGHGPDPSVH